MQQKKLRVAFIKFSGLSAGGTERWLQMMAANLPKEKYIIDYYYCDAAPYVGSDYEAANTDKGRLKYMRSHGVAIKKFKVGFKDVTKSTHDWLDTNFWEIFDESKYDLVQTAKAGHKEYPYYKIKLPIVEYVTLSAGVDLSPSITWSIHLSNWQRVEWLKNGGRQQASSVIPIPANKPASPNNLRKKLNIPKESIVAGFHQREDNNIYSPIPLGVFNKIKKSNRYFIVMGGGSKYRNQVKSSKIKNVHFINSNSEAIAISEFLNTLDIFAHGRKDGETFGTVLAEALMHGLPCLSHMSKVANAQPETMGPSGLFATNEEDYAFKLEQLFSDSRLRDVLSGHAKPFANKNYSLESSIAELEKVYQYLFAGGKKPNTSVPDSYLPLRVKHNNAVIRGVKKVFIIVSEPRRVISRMQVYLKEIKNRN